jgi:PAS domain-containing protein
MLSARAGEEAEAEGLEAGADDYLVKPFTARELLARVHTHVGMHRLRKELTAREQELRRKAEDAEYRYRSMLESISEAFLFVDRDWRICYANSQYAAIIGADIAPLLGKNLWEVFPNIADTAFAQSYRLAMNQGTIMRLEDYYAPLKMASGQRLSIGRWALDIFDGCDQPQRERTEVAAVREARSDRSSGRDHCA